MAAAGLTAEALADIISIPEAAHLAEHKWRNARAAELGLPAEQPSATASGSGTTSDVMDGACGAHVEKQLLALHRTWCEEDYTWCGQEMTGQLVRKGQQELRGAQVSTARCSALLPRTLPPAARPRVRQRLRARLTRCRRR